MNWEQFKQRFRHQGQPRTAPFTLPRLILEIQPGYVLGASLDGSARSGRRLEKIVVKELGVGVVEAVLNRPNVAEARILREVVANVTAQLGTKQGSLGLLIPDGSARVSELVFETLPTDRREAESLMAWRLKSSLSFPLDEARISYQEMRRTSGEIAVLVTAARRSVLAEYEAAVGSDNGGPSLILPVSLALLPLVGKRALDTDLVVHLCSGWMTVAIVAGGRLRMWRTRKLTATDAGSQGDEVISEINRVLASARDSLGIEVARLWLVDRAWLVERPQLTASFTSRLERAVAVPIETLRPGPELGIRLPAHPKKLYERLGAPLAGVIANASLKA